MDMADVVAAVVALTNWKVDYILHRISYPQLLLVVNRQPHYGSSLEKRGKIAPSIGALKKFGGENG